MYIFFLSKNTGQNKILKLHKTKPQFSPIRIAVPISTGRSSNHLINVTVTGYLKNFVSSICKYSGKIFNGIEALNYTQVKYNLPEVNIANELELNYKNIVIRITDSNDNPCICVLKILKRIYKNYCAKDSGGGWPSS